MVLSMILMVQDYATITDSCIMPSEEKVLDVLDRFVGLLPYMLPVAMTGFCFVAVSLLLLDSFHTALLLGVAVPVSVAFGWLVWIYFPYERTGRRQILDYIVIFIVIGWMLFNGLFTSQHIFTNRDPAAYVQAGMWLKDNSSLKIPSETEYRINGFRDYSGGFALNPNDESVIMAHGQHALGGIFGFVARIVGPELALRLNVVIGGMALLAFYGLLRFIVGRWLGLAGVIALAVSLPMMYFSRDMYTEPLVLLLTMGGLSLVCAAIKAKEHRRVLWSLAGLVVGAGSLVRIDAYLSIAGLILVMALLVVFLGKTKAQTIDRVKDSLLFMAGVVMGCIVGFLDLYVLSVPYFKGHDTYLFLEIVACLLVLALGVVLVAGKNSRIVKSVGRWLVKYGPVFSVVVVLAGAVALVSRPLWLEVHSDFNGLVAGLQERDGVTVDGTRTYAENSLEWISWYGGWPLILLGFVGIAIASYRAIRHKDLRYIAILSVVLGALLIYVIRPTITPDHVWAIRRFLPVIIPGLILFSLVALRYVYRWSVDKRAKVGGVLLVGIGLILLIAAPLQTTKPFVVLRTHANDIAAIRGLCQSLPPDALVVWVGTGATQGIQPTRTFCQVSAIGYGKLFEQDELPGGSLGTIDAIARDNGKRTYVAAYGNQVDLVRSGYPGAELREVARGVNYDIRQTVEKKPTEREGVEGSIVVGEYVSGRIVAPEL